ncbi:protein of unknown function [Nitratireductor aquimarinus]
MIGGVKILPFQALRTIAFPAISSEAQLVEWLPLPHLSQLAYIDAQTGLRERAVKEVGLIGSECWGRSMLAFGGAV